MPLELRRHDSAAEFADAALLFLLQHEAEHCLLIGIVSTLLAGRHAWLEPFTFVTVEADGRPVAAAVRTPPWQPAISRVTDPAAIPSLVEAFASDPGVAGISGPADAADAFASAWAERTGAAVRAGMRQRIYRLERVRFPTGVRGRLRRAGVEDHGLLLAWVEAFTRESLGEHAPPGHAERAVTARLAGEQSGFALWEDGQPVCLAGYSGPTPNGIRIGPVYTPPEHRRRGYASAAVARLSRELLDEGRAYCALFADLANPTANRIYQEIGYEPVADFAQLHFDPPADEGAVVEVRGEGENRLSWRNMPGD